MRITLAAFALLAGCASVAAQEQPAAESAPAPAPGATCDAARAQALVGRRSSPELGSEAQRLTGAADIRWIRPGDMVTMDYREDRLNIELDEQGRVTRLRCG